MTYYNEIQNFCSGIAYVAGEEEEKSGGPFSILAVGNQNTATSH